MPAADLLSERLRFGIVNNLGWDSLRPIQEAAIAPILEGHNVVLIAPTAGGKTEAAFLPLLDAMHSANAEPVAILYVSPLKALLNNQERRAERLASLVGYGAFKWHGDVTIGAKKAFKHEPEHVLLTTPESLEGLLISSDPSAPKLFAGLRAVIVDEVHAFAASDRGAHLMAILERLQEFAGADLQRIGLSATVQNPAEIGAWLKGRSSRAGRVVRVAGSGNREARVYSLIPSLSAPDPVARRDELLGKEVTSGKTLLFTQGRKLAEELADTVARLPGLEYVGVYHSAVSREQRQVAEDMMASPSVQRACVACTSAMELGIDIGDLDAVLQWDAPGSVASLLQRWGRSGRRDRPSKLVAFATTDADLVMLTALLRLAERGWVEPVRVNKRALHILFQQTLLLTLQHHGLTRDGVWERLQGSGPFMGVQRAEFDALVNHLVSTDILALVGGVLVLGDEGEKRLGGRNFQQLIVSFETPMAYTVVQEGGGEIGTLDQYFVEMFRQRLMTGEKVVFLLAGRRWLATKILDEAARVMAKPAANAGAPTWNSMFESLLEREVAEERRAVLLDDRVESFLDAPAQERLNGLRASSAPVLREGRVVARAYGKVVDLHTHAGTRINATLAAYLRLFGLRVMDDPFMLRVTGEDVGPETLEAVQAAWVRLATTGVTDGERSTMVEGIRILHLSKYQVYLPRDQARDLTLSFLFAPDELSAFTREFPALSVSNAPDETPKLGSQDAPSTGRQPGKRTPAAPVKLKQGSETESDNPLEVRDL